MQKTKTPFHVLGLKCQACGSYNTTRIGGDDPLPAEALGNVAENLAAALDAIVGDVEDSDSDRSWETLSNEEHTGKSMATLLSMMQKV